MNYFSELPQKFGKHSKHRVAVFAATGSSKLVQLLCCVWKITAMFSKTEISITSLWALLLHNPKSWMATDIMTSVVNHIDHRLSPRDHQVILFLNNASDYPEILQHPSSTWILLFLLKITNSKLQLTDAGGIKNFKAKYYKHLVRHEYSTLNSQ